MENKSVWLFPQNACNIKQFFLTLNFFGKLNGISREENVSKVLIEQHSKKGTYNPHVKGHNDISSANHKIDEPRFYGAIYETPNKKIHVSTYGELLLKYEKDIEKRNKIFIGMLFTIQFVNPYKNKKGLNIYPLRLIFKLLSDDRIEKKLSNDEVSHILYYIKQVKGDSEYDNIITTSSFIIIPKSPCNHSAGCKYIAGTPIEAIVAAIFLPI